MAAATSKVSSTPIDIRFRGKHRPSAEADGKQQVKARNFAARAGISRSNEQANGDDTGRKIQVAAANRGYFPVNPPTLR